MKTIIYSALALGFSYSAVPNAEALEIPALTRFISQEISTMSRAVDGGGTRKETSNEPSYYFRQFLVRVRASIGFEVPWLVSFQIVPEVEMVWQRNFPK